MYTIDAILWSYANGQLNSEQQTVYSVTTQDSRPVAAATGSFEISEGGSIQFTLAYTHPLYNSLIPLETYIAASDDTEEIFYGRILSRSDPTFTGQITYVAEGALSFLHDGEVPPEARDSKGQQTTRKMTAEAFFRWCIEQHNATVADPRRQFTVGQITIDKKNEEREYQVTSYTDTRSAFDQYLRNVYGGYLRARRENGTLYIDWLKQFERLDPQAIDLGVNIQQLTNTLTADGIYTVLRPVGTNGLLLDPETIDLFPADKMATMGRIVKSVTFQNADTKEKLQQVATDYASRMEKVILGETNIKLVDTHYLDGTIPRIRIGDRFDHIHGNEGTEFTVSHMDVDFMRPENDTFSFKNRKDLEGDLSSGLSGGTLSKATGRGAKSAGLGLKYYSESNDKAVLATKEIEIRATELLNVIANNFRISTTNYERLVRTFEVEDGFTITEWPDWQKNHEYHKDDKVSVEENHKRVGYICLDDHTSGEDWETDKPLHWMVNQTVKTNLTTLWGTEVIQNSNQIASVAGNFQVLTDYYVDWPEWIPDHDYKINDRAKRFVENTYYGYVCVRAHHSGTDFETDIPLYWEEQHGRKSVRLIDGAAFEIDDQNGNMMTVGSRIDTLGNNLSNLTENVDEQGLIITGMVGSALWTQRDHITGVSGQFNVVTDTVTGEKRIVIVSGGGMTLSRNNAEYGLYDEGNMSGGLLVDRINTENWGSWLPRTFYAKGSAVKVNGVGYICTADHTSADTWDLDSSKWRSTTQTKIKGDIVDIEARQVRIGSTSTVEQWMTDTDQNIDDLEGIVADKATIAQLNAQKARIDTLETDYLRTTALSSAFTNLQTANVVNTLQINTTGQILFIGTDSGERYTLNTSAFKNMIKSASVRNNVLTLTPVYGDPITFSKATSLSGAWSGRTFTVTASPQGNTYSETLQYSTGSGYGTVDSITVDSFSSAHWAYARVLQSSAQGGNVLYGFKINATGQYNAGWDYGLTQITRSARAATSQETTVKTLDYSERWTIVDTRKASNGTTTDVKYTVAAKADRYNDGVTAGKNAVTITKGSWSGGQIAFTKSEGTASTKNVQLTAASASWSGNTASVAIWDGTAADAQHGVNTGYTVTVNAATRYNAGVTDGANGVTLSGSWSGRTFTVTASNGKTYSEELQYATGAGYGSVDTITVNSFWDHMACARVMQSSAQGGNVLFGFKIDASGEYNAGYTDGYAAAGGGGSWSWNSQGFVDNTNNLPSGTQHQVNNLKNQIVSYRGSQGYIYFRMVINGSYHVFYFADNGNGWTS